VRQFYFSLEPHEGMVPFAPLAGVACVPVPGVPIVSGFSCHCGFAAREWTTLRRHAWDSEHQADSSDHCLVQRGLDRQYVRVEPGDDAALPAALPAVPVAGVQRACADFDTFSVPLPPPRRSHEQRANALEAPRMQMGNYVQVLAWTAAIERLQGDLGPVRRMLANAKGRAEMKQRVAASPEQDSVTSQEDRQVVRLVAAVERLAQGLRRECRSASVLLLMAVSSAGAYDEARAVRSRNFGMRVSDATAARYLGSLLDFVCFLVALPRRPAEAYE
jgi:hypothetical protein